MPFFKTGKEMRERLNKADAVARRLCDAASPGWPGHRLGASNRVVHAQDRPLVILVPLAHRHRGVRGRQPRDRHRLVRSVRHRRSRRFALTLPLFMLIFVAGRRSASSIGGVAAWLRQEQAGAPRARRAERAERASCAPEREVAAPRAAAACRIAVADPAGDAAGAAAACASSRPTTIDRVLDLSGAGRGAATSLPRRHRGAAAPSPHDPAASGARRRCC